MSDTVASLRRKIDGAADLQSVVRTMKALAGASIGQYERSVAAIADYSRIVDQGLSLCLRDSGPATAMQRTAADGIGAVVFGSDQGLVGAFNDVVAAHAVDIFTACPDKPRIWVIGERVHERLADTTLPVIGSFPVPLSVTAIAPLVGRILVAYEARRDRGAVDELHIIHNRPRPEGVYAPVSLKLLPLDETWRQALSQRPWPAGNLPEILGSDSATLGAFLREYLFVALFRACAESLASENAARLAAMERADKNIDDLLLALNSDFRRLRQTGIDEELFDVVAGYEALTA